MREPRSKLVRGMIAGRHMKDRQPIDELLKIEEIILRPATTPMAGMHSQHLRACHPAEFDAIHAELRPDDFRARQQERARSTLAMTRQDEQERRARLRQEAKDLALWVSLGGLP